MRTVNDNRVNEWMEKLTNDEARSGMIEWGMDWEILPPTIDIEKAREAKERYFRATVDASGEVKVIMLPVLVSVSSEIPWKAEMSEKMRDAFLRVLKSMVQV